MSFVKSVKQTVLLNVYDLNPQYNSVAHFVGFGTYHCGIEFYGVEYTFGESGMSSNHPKGADNGSTCTFRESIKLGESSYTLADVSGKFTRQLKDKGYLGRGYDTLKKNCNHFCDDLAQILLDKQGTSVIPVREKQKQQELNFQKQSWVNRAANWGSWFSSSKKEEGNK